MNKKKHVLLFLLGIPLLNTTIEAQEQNTSSKDLEILSGEKTIHEVITNKPQKQKYINASLGIFGGFNLNFNDGFQEGKFDVREFRLQISGTLTPWLSYNYRQKLNKSMDGSKRVDNLPGAIDYLYLEFKLNKHLSVLAGKQSVAYGGMEYEANPIDIYEFSDYINNMTNNMTGMALTYNINPKQQLQFQILNSLTETLDDTYGIGLEKAKLSLLYSLNWNGTFSENFKTRWSASFANQAKNKHMYLITLGNQFKINHQFDGFLDYMTAWEGIDRTRLLTQIVGQQDQHNAPNALYNTLILHLNYHLTPKWNLFAKGIYETISLRKTFNTLENGKYRTSYGYLAGIEYYPMKTDLRISLNYSGHDYDFTNRAKTIGNTNYTTSRIALNVVYLLPLF